MDLAVLERRKYNYLGEVLELSRQMGEAANRGDQVSLNMLVALRQEPILRLEEVKGLIDARRDSLPQADWMRVSQLLKERTPQGGWERTFLEQAEGARRLLEQVLEIDRQVSLRLAGEDSFYRSARP